VKITNKNNSIHVVKPDGTSVDYYLFPESEIHYNIIAPNTIQQWHHHDKISETVLILSGQLKACWIDSNENKQSQIINAGDVVGVEKTPHTFINDSQEMATFVVFRFIPRGTNQQEIIKKDKIIDQIN
jgi:uncharacterized RmlC-like cupin family protein